MVERDGKNVVLTVDGDRVHAQVANRPLAFIEQRNRRNHIFKDLSSSLIRSCPLAR
jgi:hypothetical protein